jgi:integrase/recombinase XerD
MDARRSGGRRRKPLAAGTFQPEISSFRLALAAEAKAAKTVRNYTEAVQWFAAAHLIPQTGWTRWEQVTGQDVQWWMVWLLSRYSDSYASNQYRALQQFFKWWAEEEELPSPMARLRPPKVTEKLIPVFTSVELSRKELAYIREAAAPSTSTEATRPPSRATPWKVPGTRQPAASRASR